MHEHPLILGLSTGFHDCAYAVAPYGSRVQLHCELERDIRIKEAYGNPLLYFLLDKNSECYIDNINQIAMVACVSTLDTYSILSRAVSEKNDDVIEELLRTIKTNAGYLRDCMDMPIRQKLKRLVERLDKVTLYGHHQSHISEAWGAVGEFKKALIISLDGGGWDIDNGKLRETHVSYALASSKRIGQLIYEWDKSFGVVYSRVTKALGFSTKPPKGAQHGSVMGLAAYGSPDRYKQLFGDDFLWLNTASGTITRNMTLESLSNLDKIIASLVSNESEDSDSYKADIAAALQLAFTERLMDFIMSIFESRGDESTDIDTICITGGCALNCAFAGQLQRRIYNEQKASKVFVSPVPYDAGLAIGTIYSDYNVNNIDIKRVGYQTPYLGRFYSPIEIIGSVRASKLQTIEISNDFIVKALDEGNVGSIFMGRSESGRRALCHRSIFADPRNSAIRDILNEKVKHRPLFRPFAPVVIEERVDEWFEVPTQSPYMSHAIEIRAEKSHLVPAVVHKDGTGRLQTMGEQDNKWFYKLLVSWYGYSGCPMLINTSFNDNEPIVETPSDALQCFLRTRIDFLVFPEVGLIVVRR